MNGALLEAFRHNSWATRQLLAFCRDLSEEQLAASATGTYGSIRATFNHIVLSEGRYLRRLAGDAPAWVDHADEAELDELDELAAWTEEAGQRWARFLSEPVDAERVVVVDDGALEVRAGVIVAQALHHGNAHREQICAVLTTLGVEPPDIQPWGVRVGDGADVGTNRLACLGPTGGDQWTSAVAPLPLSLTAGPRRGGTPPRARLGCPG